ncbi:MAG: hypothetical protein G5663_02000 [Serratia symbiotica]|nr:hypothetical protein [Serratia symbiotica]
MAALISRGRYPHQKPIETIDSCRPASSRGNDGDNQRRQLASCSINDLYGNQRRQQVWVAMVLAQQTTMLLLDGLTIYMDIVHQIDLFDLLRQLNHDRG